MSEPRLTGAKPAATAAALPPLEPPGTRDVSTGFFVGPNAEFSVLEPIANSSRFVLPTEIAPAARKRDTTVASYGGFHPSRMRDEHVVSIPRVQRLSFNAMGTPASGPTGRPAAMSASISSACARAASAVTMLNALISPSCCSIRARCASITARAESAPLETASAIPDAVVGIPLMINPQSQ